MKNLKPVRCLIRGGKLFDTANEIFRKHELTDMKKIVTSIDKDFFQNSFVLT